ncbi:MAG: hypothetical protein B7X55_06130, partial [Rhodobacterales bacterium 34-62-10]
MARCRGGSAKGLTLPRGCAYLLSSIGDAMRALILAVILLIPCWPAIAQDRAAVEQQFRVWLDNTVWPRARAAGVARATHEAAFQGVTLMWDLPDLVPPGSTTPAPGPQRQGEFGSPAAYFAPATVAATTRDGITMARRHAATLEQVERATGVPGRIILAIWGRESAFGRASIPHDAFAVLGTKGFMATRADYFTDELIAALQLADTARINPRSLRSSWAGALGQPQFMPSNVLDHARDGDGDGHADIWGSEADTIASIAAYLAHHGWQAGRDWGFEVVLPPQGLLLTDHLATSLEVKPGDMLEVQVQEGRRPVLRIPLAAVVNEYVGVGAYIQRGALTRMLGEGDSLNQVLVAADPQRHLTLARTFEEMPGVLSVTLRERSIAAFNQLMDESLLVFTLFSLFLAGSIAFAVVYNNARIAFAERGRELASLRVMGFTQFEVASLLIGEQMLLTLLALLPGFSLGTALCWLLSQAMQTDLYRIPLVLQPATFAQAALVVLLATLL